MSRVVITGLGAITPLGNDVATFWENMKAGVSGAARISSFDPSNHTIQIACEVKDFDSKDWMDKKMAKRLARSTHFSVATARQALADANFEVTPENSDRVGVVFNTGGGGIAAMEEGERQLLEQGPRAVSPFLVTKASNPSLDMSSFDWNGWNASNSSLFSPCMISSGSCFFFSFASRLTL